MNIEDQGKREPQIQGCWIPNKAYRPILRRPQTISPDTSTCQIIPDQPRSEKFYSGPVQVIQTPSVAGRSDCGSCSIADNRGLTSTAGIADVAGSSVKMPSDLASNLSLSGTDMTFSTLMALANANSLPPAAAKACMLDNQIGMSAESSGQLYENQIKSAESIPDIDGTFATQIPQPGFPASHCYYDLNMPPEATEDATFYKQNSQFAPLTPDKIIRAGQQKTDTEHLSAVTERNKDTESSEPDITIINASEPLHDEQVQLGKDSLFKATSTPSKDNDNPNKDGDHSIDLNKTPLKKTRPKKHRPKVINERKPRTPKPVIPSTAASKDSTKTKRKYVRKKGLEKTTPAEANAGSIDPKMEPTKRLCRKALSFDTDEQKRDHDANLDAESTVLPSNGTEGTMAYTKSDGTEGIVANTQPSTANVCLIQESEEYISSLGSLTTPTKTTLAPAKPYVNSPESRTNERGQVSPHSELENSTQLTPSPADLNCRTEGKKPKRSKRKCTQATEQAGGHTNLTGTCFDIPEACGTTEHLVHFPNIHKKKRTEKVQYPSTPSSSSMTRTLNILELGTILHTGGKTNFTPDASNYHFAPQSQTGSSLTMLGEPDRVPPYRVESGQETLTVNNPTKKRRSKSHTQIHNSASQTKAAECRTQQTHANSAASTDSARQILHDSMRHHSCVEVLTAKTPTPTRKRRTKKSLIVDSGFLQAQESHAQIVIYDLKQCFANSSGTAAASPKHISNEMLIEKLQQLDINRESQHKEQQLVLYKRDGTMIPFEGSFDPAKKSRPRPKVELDEETERVWKLLLENINSQGIDGTDEEKKKWWEEEREVFRGRVDSFIARMRLVQGDRRFSPWKGSVVDSVVGVFLTQNVSDHLSSSAFMALAARFPRKSEEGTSIVTDETDLSMSDSVDFIKWNEQMSSQTICKQRSPTVNSIEQDEEIKDVNSRSSRVITGGMSSPYESASISHQARVDTATIQITRNGTDCLTGERKTADDTASSQNSLVSSQNSVSTPIPWTMDKVGLCSESNLVDLTKGMNFSILNSATSFMELLQMQGQPSHMQGFTMQNEVHSNESTNVSSEEVTNGMPNQSESHGIIYEMRGYMEEKPDISKSSSGEDIDPSSNYQLLSNTKAGLTVQSLEMTREENRLSATFINKDEDENCRCEENAATPETVSQFTAQDMSKTSAHRAPEFSGRVLNKDTIFWPESGHSDGSKIFAGFPPYRQGDALHLQENLSHSSCNMGDVTEVACSNENPSRSEQKAARSNTSEHDSTTAGGSSKPRPRRVARRKNDERDWDSFRREVEAKGKKKREDNTMDSLDWEAVRCAEVREIAETIKERGMNNMLAERIKEFLNRLVEDHGSIDLEWLRDIPPDKAKEYLLSIRGLGLKSVECVRLLTLHHLAFPVDTNVGRIAVRLGWVPLQPLPESLQIHLLELYPVLESIQKYLWPRLCKLDQRTLYELHYHMITFGKVFCTKSKPNCNACPLRGECRHFASAFASSRLALPGLEERSIVSAAEQGASHQSTAATIDQMVLPLPPPPQQSKESQQAEEIIGPCSIEPIVEVPATPEPESAQTLEIDIEDAPWDDEEEIPTIRLNIEEFQQNLHNYMQQNTELQVGELSKALVALTPEVASIPTSKLKNVSRLRTEHQVYELPDSHPLLDGLEKREPDDPCSYLFAIWTPGETVDSIQPPENRCNSQGLNRLCDDMTCFSCNSIREANSQTVRGTLLIPCRTAMRGSFPLNGTYFQVNEVFADHESSLNPINVPRDLLWNLPRRTVYFGTSVTSILRGLSTADIQQCFWRGYVCVRGFDQKTRAPRPLIARLHFPVSRLTKTKDKIEDNGQSTKVHASV